MTRAEVFAVVQNNILEVLPDLDPALIEESKSMRDLGANSIDRADIIIETMQQLTLTLKISNFSGISNIGGLVDFLFAQTNAR
ncbi:MAG TPA: acyl carrier protein [Acidobacteriaceae bacterium]|jgi:polyketide biosynthesis acyl carrier protein|nr:acyl carrier protein [Acidobacteriaceae bacterium]